MALTARISLHGGEGHAPEDYLSSALGVLFPDDVTNQHGDGCAAEDVLAYTSPHLPRPLRLRLGRPAGEQQRRLFSHHLWNAALLLAEMLEADALRGGPLDVKGKTVLEVGAGAGLPSIMAGLLGASAVVATDYPAEALLDALGDNLAHNVDGAHAPEQTRGIVTAPSSILVRGHAWGVVPSSSSASTTRDDQLPSPPAPSTTTTVDPFTATHRHAFDLVLAADCLWMPWQHGALLRSLDHFLRRGSRSRAWLVAGFHTGRAVLAGFLAMLRDGLEVERVWERDCEGVERDWCADRDRDGEDVSARKRWLVVVVLRRRAGALDEEEEEEEEEEVEA